MVRRQLTVKRIDPWSVLKFGAVVNLALLAIGLLFAYVIWFVVDRLNLVDQVCDIVTDVGFTQCGVNVGNLFRALVLLGLLWVVVQTAIYVFFAFLHNLIADLTGGLAFSVIDDTPGAAARGEVPRTVMSSTSTPPPASGARPAPTGGGSDQQRAAPAPYREPGRRQQEPVGGAARPEDTGEHLFRER